MSMVAMEAHKFAVRKASGTFIFSLFFIAHLLVLLCVIEGTPVSLFTSGSRQAFFSLGVYALSFAISLLAGLCLVSSAYTPHYCKIGLMISVPNALLFFFYKPQSLETVLLLTGNQLMAVIFILGGLFIRFLVPFKMVQAKRSIPSAQQPGHIMVNIPLTPMKPQGPSSVASNLASVPGTPLSGRLYEAMNRGGGNRPVYFPEAGSETSSLALHSPPPPTYHPY